MMRGFIEAILQERASYLLKLHLLLLLLCVDACARQAVATADAANAGDAELLPSP